MQFSLRRRLDGVNRDLSSLGSGLQYGVLDNNLAIVFGV